jgi:hypothetical protein|tara:strand:- start:70 stop:234 length:165 start_codon:yes stop_codon:yes gene_type:complete
MTEKARKPGRLKPSKPSRAKPSKPSRAKPFPRTQEVRSSKGKHKYRKGSHVKKA